MSPAKKDQLAIAALVGSCVASAFFVPEPPWRNFGEPA
jgi:hypothetical protein